MKTSTFSIIQRKDIFLVITFVAVIVFFWWLITQPLLFSGKEVKFEGKLTDTKNLQKHVQFLSTLQPSRNYANLHSLNKAKDYIKNEFLKYCELVNEQTYSIGNNEYANVVCIFNSEVDQTIVYGAHYDSYADTPGADDNASGVAGILELARLIFENGPRDNRIELVAYTLEEPRFFSSENMGSFVHAKSLRIQKKEIRGAIILEMIGYFDNSKNSQEFPLGIIKPFYPNSGDFIAIVGNFSDIGLTRMLKKKMNERGGVQVYSFNAPSFIKGVDFSDHSSYWKNGYKAVMVTDTSFLRNHNYHQTTDTYETLNFEMMALVVDAVYWSTQ